jgi:hypothetical protein
MKFQWKITILEHTFMGYLQTMKKPTEPTWGKSSRIPKTAYHALFFDYDSIDEEALVDEQKALMEEWKYGNVYVFSVGRPNAYHCVCVDRFRLNEIRRILMSSSCDLGFVLAPRFDRFRNWVLRDAEKGSREKPKYEYMISSPYEGQRLQSSAHAEFLRQNYSAPLGRLPNPDGNYGLNTEGYLTAKRTVKDK